MRHAEKAVPGDAEFDPQNPADAPLNAAGGVVAIEAPGDPQVSTLKCGVASVDRR